MSEKSRKIKILQEGMEQRSVVDLKWIISYTKNISVTTYVSKFHSGGIKT